jgi:hypothetical protein
MKLCTHTALALLLASSTEGFHLRVPSASMACRSANTALRYVDGHHHFDGPSNNNVYTTVTAEVLLPDAFVPPEAKRAYVVDKDDDLKVETPADEPQTNPDEPIHLYDSSAMKTLEGGQLKTWNLEIPEIEHVQLCLKNAHGPLNAKADVFCGGGHAPMQLAVYSDNGATHPFSGVICTPFMQSHSIGVKNSGSQEHAPMRAAVIADMESFYRRNGGPSTGSNLGQLVDNLLQFATVRRIHGGCQEAFRFTKPVESVQVLLRTDGRPCQARIELTSGRDGETIQQVVEVYSEDGLSRPFFAVLDTPDLSSLVRVVNVGDDAFPFSACVEPYMIDADYVPPSSNDEFPQPPPPHPEEIGYETMPPPPPFGPHGYPPEEDLMVYDVDVDITGIPGIEDDVGFFFMD